MQVKQYLEMYLQQAEDLMSLKENEEKMVDLCLLIIQCLEVKKIKLVIHSLLDYL